MAGGAWPLSYVSSGRKAAKLHRSTLTLPAFSLPAPLALVRPTRLSSAPGAWMHGGRVGTVELSIGELRCLGELRDRLQILIQPFN